MRNCKANVYAYEPYTLLRLQLHLEIPSCTIRFAAGQYVRDKIQCLHWARV